MDEEIDRLVVAVRADTGGFARDVAGLRANLEDGLGQGSTRAGNAIESALVKAVRTGKLSFDDLRKTALAALGDIASSALSSGLGALFGGGGGSGGGLVSLATKLAGAALGLPGRATGGAVTGGRGYLVGEQGPELFVPAGGGQVTPIGSQGGRDVRVSISIASPAGAEPQALAKSSRQVARAVRAALDAAER